MQPLTQTFDQFAANRITDRHQPGLPGALALLESFYYAFNQRDLTVFQQVWAQNDLIQLNNPLGGVMRGYQPISDLYTRIFTGPARVWVAFYDIVAYTTPEMIVFAGKERGEFATEGVTVPLEIRTTRVVQWFGPQIGWQQVHHHGSIDNPGLLARYQQAVHG